jgi:F-type H+-transporting ATPase subunit b
MESTLNALGGILLNAIPTFLLIIFLHFYLKNMFFKPMERVLHQRDEATEGARRRAEESLAKAEDKSRQYEEALRAARNEIYKEQDQQRLQWKAEQDKQVAEAQERSRAQIAAARAQLAADTAAAKASLETEAQALAGRIADSLLSRRPL